jgi:YD repeat-containing protein
VSDGSGGAVAYAYDDLHRLTRAAMVAGTNAGPVVTLGYDDADRLTGVSRGLAGVTNTVDTTYSYDSDDRLTAVQHTWTGGSDTFTYAYDSASRVTQYTSSRAAEGTITFGYDASAQLTNVTSTSYSETFTYDTNGNRTMSGYSTGAGNRLTSDGT